MRNNTRETEKRNRYLFFFFASDGNRKSLTTVAVLYNAYLYKYIYINVLILQYKSTDCIVCKRGKQYIIIRVVILTCWKTIKHAYAYALKIDKISVWKKRWNMWKMFLSKLKNATKNLMLSLFFFLIFSWCLIDKFNFNASFYIKIVLLLYLRKSNSYLRVLLDFVRNSWDYYWRYHIFESFFFFWHTNKIAWMQNISEGNTTRAVMSRIRENMHVSMSYAPFRTLTNEKQTTFCHAQCFLCTVATFTVNVSTR